MAVHDITFNPMWVAGFDTVLGPSDDLMPRGPSSQRVDHYALEWGDRLGEAINNFRATRTRATIRAAQGAASHLSQRSGQAVGLVKQRKFDVSTLEGRRVVLLTVDAQGLLKDAVAHDACARSMSAAEWSVFLTVTGMLTLSIRL
ncbi:MAG: hypothetical protein Q8N10_00955 [Phenylobacterium sp.]|uniref:hypothetical protein n=1 Tax=Phenylobacterium sp. TaxID=1871053 RepID=UPI0027193B61|nr:hypothetical protein [Phenylobacterium sp.]MDO8910695.1 hypothetical protein [Phenylobacterium sp.]MDP3099049.1 hypothetical protein [Phenylobacterium sp.]